ncbi:protein root UVB sensitive 6 [Populus alba]|uniref:Protein root UVB sensitive 6 n=1 Tax=Populus alba TaxID=43335 RepID=A0A4U5PR52_POPAL|nr:protein root UVB sensitive 6 [Populus alba]TKR99413.1 protein root UVB sensitive 6 [Populus alba]
MPPIKMKQSPNHTAQTLTTSTTSSQEARRLVRETLRISANLASSPSPPANPPTLSQSALLEDEFLGSTLRLICCEEIDGRRWKYVAERDDSGLFKKNSIRAVGLQTPQAPVEELMGFIRSYVVPEGFPDSVIPSYVPYMTWRALKHFFGGAMGVFTTKTLLNSVGVSKSQAIPGAVAINWILKDGAGRVGKMLYARQGKKFDYDLKQLRFAGDLLMELGAAVELATAAVPHLFLPLACAANVAKNVAAVTSTSTRTPIYKAFAKGENIGDVTAKGECVGNVADLLGTGLSIMISKRNPSLVTTFALLSCGYVFSSYQEVKSVVLHTLNRARFSVAVESFLKTGQVPSLHEGNVKENIFNFPWLKDRSISLGPRFKDAFQDPRAYLAIEPLFERERYIVTYNPSKDKVYALLKDQAKPDDIVKAAFHAHVLMHFIHSSNNNCSSPSKQQEYGHSNFILSAADLESHIAESCKMVSTLYAPFKSKAAEQGWRMSESHLNPGRARLVLNS